MDTLDSYRHIIRKVLTEYAQIPYAHGDIQRQAVFDCEGDHYLLMIVGWESAKPTTGWEGIRRVHGCLVHIDIIDGKVWIQRDGTEHGIAGELVEAGVPKDHIVLGFRSPEIRKYTEFAVA